MEKIKVLIADDAEEVREGVRQMLLLEDSFQVVGTADNGQKAVEAVRRLKPHVVLMDINMPQKDGIAATEEITLEEPNIAIVILSAQGEQEYLRKAMAAGARDYLVKPFTPDQLFEAILKAKEFVDRRSQLVVDKRDEREVITVSVFGTKGGVGKSVLASNLAVAMASLRGETALLCDLNLEFGDIPLLFDTPVQRSLADFASSPELMDSEALEGIVLHHEKSGLHLLAGSPTPALAETVTPQLVERVLALVQENYAVVVMDLPGSFKETTLMALDKSTKILLVTGLDLPTIKNTKLALDVMSSLEYSPEKIDVVLNRADSQTGIRLEDVEKGLGRKVSFCIPSDGLTVLPSVNRGEPFVMGNREKPISQAIESVARSLLGIEVPEGKPEKRKIFSLFKRG